jgi:hypothetical protein
MSATIDVNAKVRRMWAMRLAGWLLTLPRVRVKAGRKNLGNQPIPFRIVVEETEIGRIT